MKILNIVFFAIVAVACKDSSDDDKMHVVKNDNPLSEFSVKVGEKVLYNKYAGSEVILDTEKYLIIKETDILAIVK